MDLHVSYPDQTARPDAGACEVRSFMDISFSRINDLQIFPTGGSQPLLYKKPSLPDYM
jgi:hypothetical protein